MSSVRKPALVFGFLMHRVELKVITHYILIYIFISVPNAPCGVERSMRGSKSWVQRWEFLMHRVELKVECVARSVYFPLGS